MELGWKEGIDRAGVYAIVGDNSYFKDKQLMKELEYAKMINKPMIVFIVHGTIIPPNIFGDMEKTKFILITGDEKDDFFDNHITQYIDLLNKKQNNS